MPNNYQHQVFTDYERKRNKQALSLNLMQPTRSGLREECLHVYVEKGCPKNDPALRLFFGPIDVGNDYVQRIKNFDVDKFRPLVKFLKGETVDTKDKNIALLAWLIKFQFHPYQIKDAYEISVSSSKIDREIIQVPKEGLNEATAESKDIREIFDVTNSGAENKDLAESENVEPNKESFNNPISIPSNIIQVFSETGYFGISLKYKNAIITFTAAIIVLVGSFFVLKKNEQCMYWTGNQYESISCDEKIGEAEIIALDTFKVAHLKKITRPDTITQNSIGKVWYTKIKMDSVEFYTGAGKYPLNNRKRLLPLTDYILNKYVFHK